LNIKSTQMYKKINYFNFFIALFGTTVIYLFDKNDAVFFLLGLVLANVTLFFNLMYVDLIFNKAKNKYRFITFFGFSFRVILVCAVGLMVFNYYNTSIIVYMLGYSSQIISLVLYGINIKECEGK
jgi:ATP synthase protein I